MKIPKQCGVGLVLFILLSMGNSVLCKNLKSVGEGKFPDSLTSVSKELYQTVSGRVYKPPIHADHRENQRVTRILVSQAGQRLKRQVADSTDSNDRDKMVVTQAEEVGTDPKSWFNKPTAPEVIVPLINAPLSAPSPSEPSEGANNQTKLAIGFSPAQQSNIPLSLSNTNTDPPNIFYPHTPAPHEPLPVFAPNSITNSWNQNGPPPGYPPSNAVIHPNIPSFVFNPWYQKLPISPSFSSVKPTSDSISGIFFPDYRFSNRNHPKQDSKIY